MLDSFDVEAIYKDTDEVSKVERYKVVTAQIQYFNEKTIESFKLFIQLVTAVTAGYIWLRINSSALQSAKWMQWALPALMIFIGLTTSLLIVVNISSWWGYRVAEAKLLNNIVPPPKFPKSARQEIIMITVILLTSGIGAWFFAH